MVVCEMTAVKWTLVLHLTHFLVCAEACLFAHRDFDAIGYVFQVNREQVSLH